jgi:hypothetical protein
MAKRVPIRRAEGWKFCGAAGKFAVWHASKNLYHVTDGDQGEIIGTRDQFGLAFSMASRLYLAR